MRGDFTPFISIFFKILRPLLDITFPKGFQKSKTIGHPTLRSGGKKTFKRYHKSKKNKHTHTDRQTDTHMDKSTYRKHRPRWQML